MTRATAGAGAPAYRADIDGLRALAVLAVIGYHARIPGFGGGYLGVDVFFVISGYLITLQLQSMLPGGGAALCRFYVRRARRILPALYVLLAVSAVVAGWLFFPTDLARFGRSLALASAFLGNVGAWLDGGYFDAGERFTPLRHLWSIGVEEQFYLLYPLLLLGLLRTGQRTRERVVLSLLVLSLCLAFVARDRWPIPNFYLLPTRAWELLAGASGALLPGLSVRTVRLHRWLTLPALGGILLAMAGSRVIGFPGAGSLLACGGALILLTGNAQELTPAARLLSVRPLVFTGLISYSLYLWHAPVLAFASYWRIVEPTAAELAALLAAIYAIAATSWVCIEQPLRRGLPGASRALSLGAALALSVGLAGTGVLLMRAGLRAARTVDPVVVPVDAAAAAGGACLRAASSDPGEGAPCGFGPADAPVRVLVWGDSHAYALLPQYRALAEERGVRIEYGVMGACWPLLGAEMASAGEFWRTRCSRFNNAMAARLSQRRPALLILNAYWLDPGAATEGSFQRRREDEAAVRAGVARTLAAARAVGARVCAVLTVPSYGFPVPYALSMAARRGMDPGLLGASRAQAFAGTAGVEGVLREQADHGELTVVDPKDALCPAVHCLLQAPGGESLYRDASHLSLEGGALVRATLGRCLDSAGSVRP